jgi:SAM-dependent methyltransferase
MRLYADLAPEWYRLFTPPSEYVEEAAAYEAAFLRAVPDAVTLLELGAGAGHNAVHLARFTRTLTDLSPAMLALSRELNPGCAHVEGDLRTLRLPGTYDLVLLHDAVCYMLTEDDLRAAAETCFVHLRPGGAAVVAPDTFTETFREHAELLSQRDGDRALECVQWVWDPDPTDTTHVVDYGFLLRGGTTVTPVHDRHVEGLFPRATWVRVLQEAGFAVEPFPRPVEEGFSDEVFLCRRP